MGFGFVHTHKDLCCSCVALCIAVQTEETGVDLMSSVQAVKKGVCVCVSVWGKKKEKGKFRHI